MGGYVYRGPDPEVRGRYFFADSFPTQLWTFDPADPDGTVVNIESTVDPSAQIRTPVSFGEDLAGNLYIVTLTSGIYRIDTDMVSVDQPPLNVPLPWTSLLVIGIAVVCIKRLIRQT